MPAASPQRPRWRALPRIGGAAVVAVAIGVMNVTTYGYQILAARLLGPQQYGAFAALSNLLLVVMVVSLALQANAARRIAAAPRDAAPVEAATRLVGRRAAVAIGAGALVLAPVIDLGLRLESLPTAMMVGVSAVPLTLMGYQAGVLQGERRWVALGMVYLAAGLGRLVIGTGLLLVSPTEFWAITGVMVGAWAPVLVGAAALRRARAEGAERGHGAPTGENRPHGARGVWRETAQNSLALLSFLALTNADVVLARSVMDPYEAGLYAGGAILAKAVLFLPQFVVVLAFPSMGSTDTRRRTLLTSLAAVALTTLVVALGTWLLSGLAITFVGGAEYLPVQGSLWAFALLGGELAMLQLLIYSVLARRGARSAYLVWLSLLVLVLLARSAETVESLLRLVVIVDGVLLVVLFGVSMLRLGRDTRRDPMSEEMDAPAVGSVGGGVPAGPGADGDVEVDGQLRG